MPNRIDSATQYIAEVIGWLGVFITIGGTGILAVSDKPERAATVLIITPLATFAAYLMIRILGAIIASIAYRQRS